MLPRHSRRARRPASTTSRWLARDRPDWRPRSTRPRRGCRSWCSTSAPWRTGGRLRADRELSRLPDRHLGPGAGRPCIQPSAQVRRRARHPDRGDERLDCADAKGSRRSTGRAHRAGVQARTVVVASGAAYRRPDIPNLCRPSRAPASRTGRRRSRRSCARARRWRWLAAATRPARRSCSWRRASAPAPGGRGRELEETMSRYLVDRIGALETSRFAHGTRSSRSRDAGRRAHARWCRDGARGGDRA